MGQSTSCIAFLALCVSLGFAVNRVPTVGVVFNPFTRDLYYGIRGKGSFLNCKTKLLLKGENVEPLRGLQNALIALEWGPERTGKNWEIKIRTFEKLAQDKDAGGAMVCSVRSIGLAALSLCSVAVGALDLYGEGGCWAWDVCAGWVILEEAGGIIVDGNPGNWEAKIDGRKYLAIRPTPNKTGQQKLVEEFWGIIQGRFEY